MFTAPVTGTRNDRKLNQGPQVDVSCLDLRPNPKTRSHRGHFDRQLQRIDASTHSGHCH